MKTRLLIILCGLLPFALTGQEKGEIAVPLTDPGKIATLEVNIKRGAITITGTSRKDVFIKYEGIVADPDEEIPEELAKQGLKKISSNKMDLQIAEDDNTVQVKTENWFHSANLTIEVPRTVNLDVKNFMEGDILIKNVDGEVNIGSFNGSISATNVSGLLNANTYNGGIKVEFARVTPGKEMAFTNFNGDIDITFPKDYKAHLKMKTNWGDIYTSANLNVVSESPELKKSVDKSEGFKFWSDSWTIADMNGGGPEIMIKNFAGGIYIREKKG